MGLFIDTYSSILLFFFPEERNIYKLISHTDINILFVGYF